MSISSLQVSFLQKKKADRIAAIALSVNLLFLGSFRFLRSSFFSVHLDLDLFLDLFHDRRIFFQVLALSLPWPIFAPS